MCGIPVIRRVVEHPVIVERNKLPPPKPLPLMLTKKVGSSASSDAGTQEAASQEPCGARGGETHQDPGGASPEAGDEAELPQLQAGVGRGGDAAADVGGQSGA